MNLDCFSGYFTSPTGERYLRSQDYSLHFLYKYRIVIASQKN